MEINIVLRRNRLRPDHSSDDWHERIKPLTCTVSEIPLQVNSITDWLSACQNHEQPSIVEERHQNAAELLK
jgi:hypothetical protein